MGAPTEIAPQALYSVSEAARLLHVPRRHLAAAIESGQVRTLTIGTSPPRIPGHEIRRAAGLPREPAYAGAASEAEASEEEVQVRPSHIPMALHGISSGVAAIDEVALMGYAQRGRLDEYLEARRRARMRDRTVPMPRAEWIARLREWAAQEANQAAAGS